MKKYTLIIRPEAESDLEGAKQWYERKRPGLGDEFLLSDEEAIERISRTPEMHAPIYRKLGRTFVRRFPYGVFYLVEGDRVFVVGVFHGRRDPRRWQSRA
jgi:plasmid stabilization system protein ParE